jgi:tetratricopeptide (TPR) repeat protein
MKTSNILFITIVSVFSFNGYAQKAKVTTAEKKQGNVATIDALKTYERVAEKGYKSADMFKKLGNSCYYNTELDQAARWYGELFAMTQDVEPEYYYRYAQSLRSIGQIDKADTMLEKFNQLSENKTR